MIKRFGVLIGVALGLSVSAGGAENWPHWRGPNYNGSSSESGLPARFSKDQNVRWTAEMRGPAAATPVVWEDYVFISSSHPKTQRLLAVCFDRKTGEKKWEDVVSNLGVSQRSNQQNTYASPSPVTDGKRVIFFYGNGDMVAYDLNGEELWKRNIEKDYGEFAFLWTFSSSPLLYDGRLYLQVLQRDVPVNGHGFKNKPNKSYLLALDPKTGKELWRHIRPSKAVQESREAFTSPIPHTYQGRSEILIAGGDALSGHDPDTGKELWRWGTWNPKRITHWRLVPSPVAGKGRILVCAPKRQPVYAIKAGGEGILDDSAVDWVSEAPNVPPSGAVEWIDEKAVPEGPVSSDVATPLFYKGYFYVLFGNEKTLSCVKPKTGEIVWSHEFDSRVKFESSPVGADGKIYCVNWKGKVFVTKASDEFELLHTADMGEPGDSRVRSSVVPAQGDLLIRTDQTLYCVSDQELASK